MLENIANIAEIVGVVLVLVTLVFLTLQIRQNTRAIRSTTIQAVMQSEMAFSEILMTNAALWEKVVSGAALEPGTETRGAIILFNVFMIDTETRFHQYRSGYLDAQAWNGRMQTLPEVIALPIYETWRQSYGGRSHSKAYLDLLDQLAG